MLADEACELLGDVAEFFIFGDGGCPSVFEERFGHRQIALPVEFFAGIDIGAWLVGDAEDAAFESFGLIDASKFGKPSHAFESDFDGGGVGEWRGFDHAIGPFEVPDLGADIGDGFDGGAVGWALLEGADGEGWKTELLA